MALSIPQAILAAFLSWLKNWSGYEDTSTTPSLVMTAISGFVTILGFMVVFRSNQAWSRFWEGFTLVRTARGQWFNAASSLFAFCSRKPEKAQAVQAFQELIASLMSLLFATA